MTRLAALCTLLLLSACRSPAEPGPPSATPVTRGPELQGHMQARLNIARAGLASVVEGDVEAVRGAARALVDSHPMQDEVDPAWKGGATAFRAAALAASRATDLEGAARGMVGVAAACGGCHTAAGVDRAFELPTPPARGETIAAHMARHAWAVDRLWEALTGPAEASWTAGHRMLAEGPLESDGHAAGLGSSAAALESSVHALAADALVATDPQEREAIVAQILVACGACHAITHGGPGSRAPAAPAAP
jgi:mono/diheme cytochrome c family protein